MTICEQKKALRKQMLSERATLDKDKKEEYDDLLCKTLWGIIATSNIKTVHCYLPMGTEVNIFPLIKNMLSRGITVITPKTLPKPKMQNLILNSIDGLEKGVFGTRHPANSKVFYGQYDLIIVPGLAFDKANFRLGYGGGYYDNFLVNHLHSYKVGICYPFQNMKKIPLEKYDVQLDAVLCQNEIF